MIASAYRIIFIITSITVAASGMAYGKTEFTVEPNIGRLSGYTLYNISGTDFDSVIGNYKWESELQWPIDSTVWGVNAAVTINKRFALEGAVRETLDNDGSKMRDSDWIYNPAFPDPLVIYSESDTEMEMLDFDIKGRYSFPYSKNTNISIMGGFRHQDFSFKAKNLIQQSVDPNLNARIPGLVGKYDVKYSIPYIGAGFSSKIGEKTVLDLSAQLGYVTVNDEDDHILRYKLSTGESTGNSIGLSGNLVYDISPSVYLKLDGEYLFITANGKQTQRWYKTTSEATQGTTIPNIDLKIESFQALTTIGVGIRF